MFWWFEYELGMMFKLVFILMIMNGSEVEGQITYSSMQKCIWYASQINAHEDRLVGNYSAWCKPVAVEKTEE